MRRDDDFSPKTIETLAKRVGYRCSNPDCPKLTIGPHTQPTKTVNIGVAAHITAAAPGGKRYDASLSSEERKSIENGMWLCQNCGKLIDSDEQKYSVDLLMSWKCKAEQQASSEIESSMSPVSKDISSGFEQYLQNLIDRRQIWWLDEINDSTWHEFELFTKVQEKSEQLGGGKPQELPKPLLQAINDREKQSILITGAPGAGKSTFLEKLAIEAARKAQREHNAPIPVLVKLKDYDSSGEQPGIKGLIQSTLESYDPSLDTEATKQLLQGKGRTLLLFIDGWNELSDEKEKSKIKTFCQPHSVIVASRDAGDYSEIQQKFEIQPLSRSDVEGFFKKRLPNTERKRLQELVDRVQDFGQTPLMVWMLFSIFQNDDPIPETRGEAYRSFTAIYAKRAKAEIDLSDARTLLGELAFEMLKTPDPQDATKFRQPLEVSNVEAEEIFGSEEKLDRMLNHLLNQQGKEGARKISFCHQSIQEYYAAEQLRLELKHHPEWLDRQLDEEYSWFQRHYLNYTKWTESIALMLGLPEITQAQAEKIVEQALDVDLMLGARLAGEVLSAFQSQTITSVSAARMPIIEKPMPEWLKIKLLGTTRSDAALPELKRCFSPSSADNRLYDVLHAVAKNPSSQATELLIDFARRRQHHVRNKEDFVYSESLRYIKPLIIDALATRDGQGALDFVMEMLEDDFPITRASAAKTLGIIRSNKAIPSIVNLLKDSSEDVRWEASKALAAINSPEAFPGLVNIIQSCESNADSLIVAIDALRQIDGVEKLVTLQGDLDRLKELRKSDHEIQIVVMRFKNKNSNRFETSKVNASIKFVIEQSSAEEHELSQEDLSSECIDLCLSSLKSRDAYQRATACSCLGKSGLEIAVCNLVEVLCQDESISVKKAAIRALGNIGSSQGIKSLIEATENVHLCSYAIDALNKIKGNKSFELLPTFLNLLHSNVGREVLKAIAAIQSNCKFYNHEIEQQARERRQSAQGSQQQAQGNVYNIGSVGNLNTDTVNIQGDQIGEQTP